MREGGIMSGEPGMSMDQDKNIEKGKDVSANIAGFMEQEDRRFMNTLKRLTVVREDEAGHGAYAEFGMADGLVGISYEVVEDLKDMAKALRDGTMEGKENSDDPFDRMVNLKGLYEKYYKGWSPEELEQAVKIKLKHVRNLENVIRLDKSDRRHANGL